MKSKIYLLKCSYFIGTQPISENYYAFTTKELAENAIKQLQEVHAEIEGYDYTIHEIDLNSTSNIL